MKLKLLLRPAGHPNKVQTIAATKICGASNSQSSKKGPRATKTFDTAVLRPRRSEETEFSPPCTGFRVGAPRGDRGDQTRGIRPWLVAFLCLSGNRGGRSFGSRHCIGCIVIDPSVHQHFPPHLRLPLRIAIDAHRSPCDLCAWDDTCGHPTRVTSSWFNCSRATGRFPPPLALVRAPAPRGRAHALERNPSLPSFMFQHSIGQHTPRTHTHGLGRRKLSAFTVCELKAPNSNRCVGQSGERADGMSAVTCGLGHWTCEFP